MTSRYVGIDCFFMSESSKAEKVLAADPGANVIGLSIDDLKKIVMAPDDLYDPAFQICAYQELQRLGIKIEA